MEIIKIILISATAGGIIGFLITWAQAYSKIENIHKWSRQITALQPWWFLNSEMLSKENEYLRIRALIFFGLYMGALFALWWLSE